VTQLASIFWLPSAFEPTSWTTNRATSSAPSLDAAAAVADPVDAAEPTVAAEPGAAAEPLCADAEDPDPAAGKDLVADPEPADAVSFCAHAAKLDSMNIIISVRIVA
jgi:hypothetical protein